MKETGVIQGKSIWERIQTLKEEKLDLARACDSVSDEMGQSSVAYKILNKAYKDSEDVLNKALNKEYTEHERKPFGLDDF